VVITSSYEQRARWLSDVRHLVSGHFPAEKRTTAQRAADAASRASI
jgi:hypothetical protein